MDTITIITQINDLLLQLPKELIISIMDEEGNETNLQLDGLEYDTNRVHNEGKIAGWCHYSQN